jgi:dTDP-4-amino-4,6-dideoxygalactose transaminase
MAAVSRKLPGWPVFADDEVSAAESVLRSGRVNYWTGQEGKTFEREFAARFGRRHGIALANGTLALELALKAYGVGPGDDVVVTPRSFIASASCVITVGATPVFADVDRDSQTLTAASIEAALTPRTRAVIVVHLAGWPCDMPAIMALAQRRGLIVIEDCAQSPGAMVAGKPAGSFGHAAAFSFCQDKIITTAGEGGMLLLDDEERWSWSWSYKDHGKSFAKMAAPPAGAGFRFVHDAIGTNWRLSEVQSAVGRRQLAKLDEWVEIRREHACELQGLLGGLAALRLPQPSADLRHAYYKFYGFVAPEALAAGWTRDRLLAELTGAGVPCFTGSCGEIYREEGMVAAGYGRAERLPVARELGETSLMWLVHPTLSAEDVRHVGEVSARIIAAASR